MCSTVYFPPGSLHARPDRHASRDRWYVSHLLAMRERPLYPPAGDQPAAYRLLHLPTFVHPTVVRVVEADGWRAVSKRTDGRGGYEPGRLVSETDRSLTAGQAKRLEGLIEKAGFWGLPSFEDDGGGDGTRCVVEGVRPGGYHVVDRWSPVGTPFARLVAFLLRLAPPTPSEERPAKDLTSFAELADRFRPDGPTSSG